MPSRKPVATCIRETRRTSAPGSPFRSRLLVEAPALLRSRSFRWRSASAPVARFFSDQRRRAASFAGQDPHDLHSHKSSNRTKSICFSRSRSSNACQRYSPGRANCRAEQHETRARRIRGGASPRGSRTSVGSRQIFRNTATAFADGAPARAPGTIGPSVNTRSW